MPDMSKKTKLVFWMASHCKTDNKRGDYVKSLQQFIQIDIYGECGTLNCTDFKEFEALRLVYKFYLAFENSNCHDYITEKFWRNIGHGVVPITMGGGNYTGAHNAFNSSCCRY